MKDQIMCTAIRQFLHVISIVVTAVCALLIGALADAAEPKVGLIDAHGILVTAIVPETHSKELIIDLDFTALGRELLLEAVTKRPEHHTIYAKLGPGDEKLIIEALAQCRRWHDHFFDGEEYPAEQLILPEFTIKKELTVAGYAKRYTGKCADGYRLTFRKRQDTVLWRFDGGREFKGERAKITVRLRYDYQEEGNLGQIQADGQPIFRFDPREDTYEAEFTKRFQRSRLWEQIDARSFQLATDRLSILLGNKFDILLGKLRTHPDQTTHHLIVRPGIYAANSYIKAIEVMHRERLLEESSIVVGGEVKADNSILVLPGAMLMREKLAGRLNVKWADKKEAEKERRFRVEFGKLSHEIGVDRSAFLYLCVLHQAMSGVRYSTPDEVKNIILDDVLAEAEWKLTKP
jgi:hypothetical protein